MKESFFTVHALEGYQPLPHAHSLPQYDSGELLIFTKDPDRDPDWDKVFLSPFVSSQPKDEMPYSSASSGDHRLYLAQSSDQSVSTDGSNNRQRADFFDGIEVTRKKRSRTYPPVTFDEAYRNLLDDDQSVHDVLDSIDHLPAKIYKTTLAAASRNALISVGRMLELKDRQIADMKRTAEAKPSEAAQLLNEKDEMLAVQRKDIAELRESNKDLEEKSNVFSTTVLFVLQDTIIRLQKEIAALRAAKMTKLTG